MIHKADVERFWSKVDIQGLNDCWEWTASIKDTGYGQIRINYKTLRAHRVSWEINYGEIPENMCVLHTCDNRKCVNPKHLWLGDKFDNMQDMSKKGRQWKQW